MEMANIEGGELTSEQKNMIIIDSIQKSTSIADKWTNKPTIDDLKRDLEMALPAHQLKIDKINENNRVYNEAKPNITKHNKNKSKYTSKLLKKQLEWLIPNIEEPILSTVKMFNLTASTSKSFDLVDINSKALEYQWNNQINKGVLINQSSRKFGIDGTLCVKVEWDASVEERMVKKKIQNIESNKERVSQVLHQVLNESGEEKYNELLNIVKENGGIPIPDSFSIIEKEEKIVVKNKPRIRVRDNESIVVDPKCKGVFEDARFLIDVYETDYATLVQNKKSYINLEKIKSQILSGSADSYDTLTMFKLYNDDDAFEFSDLARKKIVIHEYWGYWDMMDDGTLVSFVGSWINDELVRLEPNPYGHNKIPYAFGSFLPINGELYGDTNADLLMDDQSSLTGTIRSMQDITNNNSKIGQEFIDQTLFDPIQKDNYDAGRTVYTRKGKMVRDSIYTRSVEPVPEVLFQMKQLYSEDAISMTGVQEYNNSNQNGKTKQSVTGETYSEDSISSREMSILRRFSNVWADVGRLMLSMNKEFLLSDAVIESSEFGIVEVENVDYLSDEFNVTVEVATPTVNNKKASRLLNMMNTNAATMSEEKADVYYHKINSLWGMNDVTVAMEKIKNRELTEQEQEIEQAKFEMVMIELKIQKLKAMETVKSMEKDDAEIMRLNTIAKSEALRNKGQAERDLATAEKLNSQKELYDQEFNLIDSGAKRQEYKDDAEYQHIANMEREEVRTKRELELNNAKSKSAKSTNNDSVSNSGSSRERNIQYLRDGQGNDSFDASDNLFRDILNKNSLDTSKFTDVNKKTDEPVNIEKDTENIGLVDDNANQEKDK